MTKSGYIRAAFRSSRHNEAYIFINDDKYVLLDYAPGTTNDKILHGPSLVSDGFKSLAPTIFQSYAIDCAFDTDNNQAFIFHENFCALIDYAPYSCNDKLISGPKKIADVFPFFKGTVFESGIDAAYRSTKGKEAYLFKGDQYARIDYGINRLVSSIKSIKGFSSFCGTIFENGSFDAAFSSHKTNEVYIFKGDHYIRVGVNPGVPKDNLIGGVARIIDNWKSLGSMIPLKN
ncbi:putative Hemopexin-like domain-containing protein [Medicago truncatula]|uniref:Albumin-2 protein n=1 Tax=Medicago truncatula TaxID=3880 RepID=G7L514_MEDTR|nr:albumin-2 [Medicago truncatula]AES81981.1 albumin-2 protein [Medicago truncatula]RHN48638.1 putative Hemopexin-like domain-containing protein [Medicago truncatula]